MQELSTLKNFSNYSINDKMNRFRRTLLERSIKEIKKIGVIQVPQYFGSSLQ
jgi:hypothetical protein